MIASADIKEAGTPLPAEPRLKILFVCSSLEPGKDGVGDYTRRLAGELIKRGHGCAIVAANDTYLSAVTREQQEIEGVIISVLRLPETMERSERANEVRHWIDHFKPNWVSLQFVLYGLDPKGRGFGLANWLAAMNSHAPWHIMFHELWLGLGKNSTFKHRLIGAVQHWSVRQILQTLRPRCAHTQTGAYQIVLGREKIDAGILPLFSNIPYAPNDGWSRLLVPLIAKANGKSPARESFYLTGVLGAVHGEWDAQKAMDSLLPLTHKFQKRLVLVFLGKNNLSSQTFDDLKNKFQAHADVVVAGERSALEISQILQSLDLGLATSPLQVIQKSGSAVAMAEHGLPLLVVRDDWHLRGATPEMPASNFTIFTPAQFAALKTLPTRNPAPVGDQGVRRVAERFLATLDAANVSRA